MRQRGYVAQNSAQVLFADLHESTHDHTGHLEAQHQSPYAITPPRVYSCSCIIA